MHRAVFIFTANYQKPYIMIKSYFVAILAMLFLIGCTCEEETNPLEGTWKIESGEWTDEGGTMVYPGDSLLIGADAYRVFTEGHHFFIASAPAMELYNSVMTSYAVDGTTLTTKTILVENPGASADETWTYTLEGDKLTMEMEGVKEVWVRIE